jgi:alkanesulfonate monooxygenase SsuD/methylene tetrahydromethanopterin reductase-like flavin-dependent oxidoreductase (luciferase family)
MVVAAEQRGFGTVWFSDLTVTPSTDPILAVATAAACTSSLRLGMTIVPFGYAPWVFARQLAQLDRLAGGRLRVLLVPGLGQPGEDEALALTTPRRGVELDRLIPMLRTLWRGEEVDSLPPLPVRPAQDALQIWLAGKGPKALARAGRLADGWRGGGMDASAASDATQAVMSAAAAAGRMFDPGHFGMTVAYARDEHDAAPHFGETTSIVGRDALRAHVERLVAVGISKFSLRRLAPVTAWDDELAWLADAVLDLET